MSFIPYTFVRFFERLVIRTLAPYARVSRDFGAHVATFNLVKVWYTRINPTYPFTCSEVSSVNIALVALAPDRTPLLPPLALAYLAALLEQQRHIVRVYDLALSSTFNTSQSARLLRAFRPHVVVVMGDDPDQLGPAVGELREHQPCVFS